MAEQKYFCAYYSYLESIEPLDDAERGRLFTALLQYSSTGTVPELTGNERFIFPTMKGNIDRDTESYNSKCQRMSQNGKLGGRPKKQMVSEKPNAFKKSKISQDKDKDNDKDKDKDKDKEEYNLISFEEIFERG